MPCLLCGSDAVSTSGVCTNCGHAAAETSLGGADAITVPSFTNAADSGAAAGPLAPGQPFGSRYQIIRVLGAGGMGVVYQAWDGELGVAVALKVIRPEVMHDPASAGEVQRRFKRELLLARQVTHRNVVRIHDLGEVGGIKYLTMPFVQGENLATIMKTRGKLPLSQALSIARQVASGLAAAHEVGVVHRDLKPENIMLGAEGEALIMDFGISRSVSGTGTATQLGAVLGTLEYMPPEQAQGQPVDHRADIYSFGLVLYDLLTGRKRLAGRDSAMSEVISRLQAGPPPIRGIDPSVPEPVARIIARCLAISPDARYATTAELVADLEALTPDGHPRQAPLQEPARRADWPRQVVIGAAVLALVLAGAAWWALSNRAPAVPPAPVEPISVLVADFQNLANDEQFEGLLEQAMAVGIEGTSFITAFSRRDALRAALQIAPGEALNEKTARLVSRREGIDRIVAGAISSVGGTTYKLDLKVVDPADEKPLMEWSTQVASKSDVLAAVGKGAAQVRTALGDTRASAGDAETFTAASIEAAHAYAKAQESTWAGKNAEAIAEYEAAIKLDPEFGRAYSGLAALYLNAGQREKALEFYKLAYKNTDRMTERERLRTRGAYYLATRNLKKANEELEALVAKYPADTAALANLAVNRVYERKMTEAMELGKRAAAIYPRNVIRRNNVALFAMYAGDFDAAEREALETLKLNPLYPKAFVALAMSQLGRGQTGAAEKTWKDLHAIPDGRLFAIAGLGDLALYGGRPADAAAMLQQGLDTRADPRQLVTRAEAQLAMGDEGGAIATAVAAAEQGSSNPVVLFLAGRILAQARQPQAPAIASSLRKELDVDPQTYGALLDGEIALSQGDHRRALAAFGDAQELADTWLGRYGLGRAQLAAGRYQEAESEFDKCLTRHGEATAVFLDEIPTYRLLPPVHYYMGLVRDGLKNERAATESFRTFLAMKKGGDEQGLVADARRRLSER